MIFIESKIDKFLDGIYFDRKVLFRQSSWYDDKEVELDITVIRDLHNNLNIKINVKADIKSEPYRAVFYFLSLVPNVSYDVCCDNWLFDVSSKCALYSGLEKLKSIFGCFLVVKSKPLDELIQSMILADITNN